MKKVLLIVIDACASRVLSRGIHQGKFPHMAALVQAGLFSPECTTVFPSITPAATSAIITGCPPCEHGILGASWYDTETEEIVYYGSDFWVILNRGIGDFVEDFLVKLNHQRLKAETLFETVERAGLQAASLNYLIYRGDTSHTASMPLGLGLLPGVPDARQIRGPSILSLGDLVAPQLESTGEPLETNGGILHKFGFEDDCTADLLLQLVRKDRLPDFTLAYFPDNDLSSHQLGPDKAITTLQHADARLGELIEAYGGLDSMLAELCLIITGDHAQTDILADEAEAAIPLDELLADFSAVRVGQPWTEENQLMICPDLRTAEIYFSQPKPDLQERVIVQLLTEERIDQVIWLGDGIYHVASPLYNRLQFWPGADGPNRAVDRYGRSWSWQGDLRTVGGQVSPQGIITFPNYPDAFRRIVGGLNCENSGAIWLTARLGYEFGLPNITIHTGGGSHGTLHKLDSTVPLLIAGAEVQLPAYPSILDVKPICLQLLEIE